ncbi:MAG: hypothetical protein KDB22_17040 [Planctomycetales bacterium]|nr:hypothetical protein [Planctomycetales bacterium]
MPKSNASSVSHWLSCLLSSCGLLIALSTVDRYASAEETSAQVLAKAQAARIENETSLTSASGNGRLKVVVVDQQNLETLEVTDASIRLKYAGSKFSFLIENRFRLRPVESKRRGQRETWQETGIAKELVMFDGDALYSVQWMRDGTCAGSIYFAFKRQAVLDAAGFPFEHPVHIWKEAVNLSAVRSDLTKVTPLIGGGFIAEQLVGSNRLRIFMFDRFGYDLRRVSTERLSDGMPLERYDLSWKEASGTFFVDTFTHTKAYQVETDPLTNTEQVVSRRTVRIEYDDFAVNEPVPSSAFQLASFRIPVGTEFVDRRSSTQLFAPVFEFDGKELDRKLAQPSHGAR